MNMRTEFSITSRGLPAVRGELVEEDTPGYHYFPGRDQAVGWFWQQGLAIVDEDFRRGNGWGHHHFLLRPARLHQHHDAARYCATQVSWLLRERPLDELHLLVFPVMPGHGKRLLAAPADKVPLKPAASAAREDRRAQPQLRQGQTPGSSRLRPVTGRSPRRRSAPPCRLCPVCQGSGRLRAPHETTGAERPPSFGRRVAPRSSRR